MGEYLDEAKRYSSTSPRTFGDYCRSFRRIVSDITGEVGGKERYDYRKGGREKWVARVDAVLLETITPEKVERWRHRYVAQAESPEDIRKKKTSANSTIRQAKALFSKNILCHLQGTIELPENLPFTDIQPFGRKECSVKRYRSKINAEQLIREARDELGSPQQEEEKRESYLFRREQFKVFILAIGAGLRRKEIDTLLWTQIDFDDCEICLEANEHYGLKSDTSAANVSLDPEIAKLLEACYREAKGEFFIEAESKIKSGEAYSRTRARKVFQALYKWLREHGVATQKPLHTLRKEYGSIINSKHGLYAAQQALRHADISTTATHYLDTRERITPGLGGLFEKIEE